MENVTMGLTVTAIAQAKAAGMKASQHPYGCHVVNKQFTYTLGWSCCGVSLTMLLLQALHAISLRFSLRH